MESQHLEVTFTAKENGIEARCSAFPECKGIGLTEEDALKRLSQSIGQQVGRLTTQSLSETFLSEGYTDVVTDPFNRQNEKKRLFGIGNEKSLGKNMVLKLKPMPQISKKAKASRDISQLFDAATQHLQTTPMNPQQEIEEKVLGGLLSALNQMDPPENLGFGFPISYN